MTQFGAGPELAAQCPQVPIPDGWRPWIIETDGQIPDALAKRAAAVAADSALPLGVTESYPLPGVTTLIRVEPHAWGRNATGDLVEGCWRAGAIYLPSGASAAATTTSSNKTAKVVGVLTAVSLVVGIGATLASLGNS